MNHKHWSLYIVSESQSKNVFIYKYFGVTIVVQLTTEQRVFCLAQFTPTPNVINRVLENNLETDYHSEIDNFIKSP